MVGEKDVCLQKIYRP